MERFVRLIVGGGLAVVAGLWVLERSAAGSGVWIVGLAVTILGAAGLIAGTGSELRF